jgi:uncharacterized protein (DUF1501 family)
MKDSKMVLSRRSLVKSVAAASLAAGCPSGLRLGFAAAAQTSPVLLFVMMRGGMDGLNLVAPSDDTDLIAARPASLRLLNSGRGPALPLANGPSSNDWRLHPNAIALKTLYDGGQLAFIHAAGNPASSRSHFQMQAFVENGVADAVTLGHTNGWIARYGLATGLGSQDFALLSAEPTLPPSMMGAPMSISLPVPSQFNAGSKARSAFLQSAYENAAGTLGAQGRTALNAVGAFASASQGFTQTTGLYGTDSLSQALSVVSEMIKLNVGLQVAEVEFNPWDTHFDQQPRFATNVTTLSAALGAFMTDVAHYNLKVTAVAMSEFGRRVKSNASGGTDHGHGNVMMVMGSGVKGGRIYGQWLGLNPSVLDLGDVPVTTDYRSVLAEVIAHSRGNLPATLFPGFTPAAPLGLFAS